MGEQIEVNAVGIDRYQKLSELVKNTHKDNPRPEELAELRRLFDEDPELWRTTGNMARRTLDHLLRTYYSQSAYLRECVSRRIQEMREGLGYAESPPLERILIEQILVCWSICTSSKSTQQPNSASHIRLKRVCIGTGG